MVWENWEVLKLAASLWKTPFTIYFSSNIKGAWQSFPDICTLGVGYACVYLFKHAEVVSFWITFHLVFEDSLSLNLKLTNLAGWAHQWVPGTLLLLTSSNETIGACDHAQPLGECWGLNSGPHVCTIKTYWLSQLFRFFPNPKISRMIPWHFSLSDFTEVLSVIKDPREIAQWLGALVDLSETAGSAPTWQLTTIHPNSSRGPDTIFLTPQAMLAYSAHTHLQVKHP